MSMMKCCNECMGFITYSCLYRNGWLGDNIIVKSIDELINHYVKEITNNIIYYVFIIISLIFMVFSYIF